MTETEINKLIHEKVMEKCWHHIELRDDGNLVRAYCVKCETFGVNDNWVDYLSWADYGPMLEECMKKEWWHICRELSFARYQLNGGLGKVAYSYWVEVVLLNPLRGSTAIAEFVEANQQCFKGE